MPLGIFYILVVDALEDSAPIIERKVHLNSLIWWLAPQTNSIKEPTSHQKATKNSSCAQLFASKRSLKVFIFPRAAYRTNSAG